ncbi:hypothetical protein [Actinopolymorpha pittospori]
MHEQQAEPRRRLDRSLEKTVDAGRGLRVGVDETKARVRAAIDELMDAAELDADAKAVRASP